MDRIGNIGSILLPPVALQRVHKTGDEACLLTSLTRDRPLPAPLTLNAYLLACTSGAVSMYSMATRPSTDAKAYPLPFMSGGGDMFQAKPDSN